MAVLSQVLAFGGVRFPRRNLAHLLQDLVVGALQNAGENMRDTVKTILGPVAAASGRPMPES